MKKTSSRPAKAQRAHHLSESRIGVTKFKAQCLGLIDAVERGKTDKVVLMKRGRPVAELRAIGAREQELWGALAGSVVVERGTPLSESLGEDWKAER